MTSPALRLLILSVVCTGVLRAGDADLTVYAAASVTDALGDIAKAYEESTHVHVVGVFAASSTLAKQIENGAPADLFISADEKWADYLDKKNLLKGGTRADLLANRLVVIAPAGKPFAVKFEKGFDFAGAFKGRLAVGDPTNVPAGIYAKEAFSKLGWWNVLEPRLAPAADVRAALKLVELGEADAGVVYASDAKGTAKVEVIGTVPEDLHTPVRYPLALTASAKPTAAAFAAYLAGPEASAAFAKRGFQPLAAAAAK
jgi:molybdate transport system substrate-binding protein